jgi:hypothetical protein
MRLNHLLCTVSIQINPHPQAAPPSPKIHRNFPERPVVEGIKEFEGDGAAENRGVVGAGAIGHHDNHDI